MCVFREYHACRENSQPAARESRVYRGAGASAVPCEEDRRLTSQDEPGHGHETPEEREPGLTAALLRIGASHDLETVRGVGYRMARPGDA